MIKNYLPFKLLLLLGMICAFIVSCNQSAPYDNNTSVPKGDPPFTALTNSWVIDQIKILSEETINNGDAILEKLKEDGIAEVVVLVQIGIKHPEDYATHYGRWLRLGKAGPSSEGGNNGVVWLIRPDADDKITISVGRGLPKFTSSDYEKIIKQNVDYLNFGNYDTGVLKIIQATDSMLRKIYQKR